MLARWMLGSDDEIAVMLSKLAELGTSGGGRERSEIRSALLLTVSPKILARLCR